MGVLCSGMCECVVICMVLLSARLHVYNLCTCHLAPSCCMVTQDPGFLTALEYSDKRKSCFRISTGSAELE